MNVVTDLAEPNPILNPSDIDALTILIECVEQTSPLDQEAVNCLRKKRSYLFKLMASIEHTDLISKLPSPPLNNSAFNTNVVKIEGDLGEQVAFVSKSFSKYLELGIAPSARYTGRIAELLRRANQTDLERRFLAAWHRHFSDGIGEQDDDLVKQLRKALMTPIF